MYMYMYIYIHVTGLMCMCAWVCVMMTGAQDRHADQVDPGAPRNLHPSPGACVLERARKRVHNEMQCSRGWGGMLAHGIVKA